MHAEIELKLLILSQHHDLLVKTLSNIPHSIVKPHKTLTNAYFDTDDLQLRRWDMGLRVRGDGKRLEQTIKTAGKVIGGIHNRPEYNVDILTKQPDLGLFPVELWPEHCDVQALSSALVCIFETNFTRQIWHIQVNNSLIEVALDSGEIIASAKVEPIYELEFELISGSQTDLLIVAEQLSHLVPFRLGKASKAQRGYQLAGKSKPFAINQLHNVDATSTANLIETYLNNWQILEILLIKPSNDEQQVQLFARFHETINCLQQHLISTGATNKNIEALIAHLLQQLTTNTSIYDIVNQIQYGQLQLAVLNLLFNDTH